MANQRQLDAICADYKALMVEARARVSSINNLLNDQREIPSPFVREFGVLQIRMLCEIVALGCLVAHGDLVEKASKSKELKKSFAPGMIFSELDKLNDDYFPIPIKPEKTETGWHMAKYDGGPFATKADIRQIWNECGSILHRGSLKSLIKERTPVQRNFSDLSEWGQKLANLLNNHRIISIDRQIALITFLSHKESLAHEAGVFVFIGEAVSDGKTPE